MKMDYVKVKDFVYDGSGVECRFVAKTKNSIQIGSLRRVRVHAGRNRTAKPINKYYEQNSNSI